MESTVPTVGVEHGGLDVAELRSLGLLAGQVLDFSSNINPLGASSRVRRAAAQAALTAYPDRHSLVLREALAERLGVDKEWLLVGNGSTELIHLLARAFLRPQETCVVFEPTFGEYRAAADLAGARTISIRAVEREGFIWPIKTALQRIEQARPRLVFLCNPNNPTGAYVGGDTVQRIRKATGKNRPLVVDDAYVSLADHPWDTIPLLQNGGLIILRSMTKDHGLAGVRLGYLVADPGLIAALRHLQPAWSVNAVAQAAGLAALEDSAHLENARAVISESKKYLCREIRGLGIPVVRSAANFILAKVDAPTAVRRALLRRNIAVRDCTSFGLPEYIRIAVRRLDECSLLVKALHEAVTHGR